MTPAQKAWIQGLFLYQYGSQKSVCTGHKASLIAQEILTPIKKKQTIVKDWAQNEW